jgi:hypothetical protein
MQPRMFVLELNTAIRYFSLDKEERYFFLTMKKFTWNTVLRGLFALLVVTFSLHLFSHNKADVDLWGNVGFVQVPPWSAEYRYINTFSFTEPDHAWINHEWLAQWIYNMAFRAGGNPGLIVLKVILGLCLLAVVVWSMIRSGPFGAASGLYLLAALSTIGYGFSTRPHLFTYLLLAVFMVALKHNWPAWIKLTVLPCLGFIWANLHGAFFLGILIMAVYTISETIKWRLNIKRGHTCRAPWAPVSIMILLVLVSFITPYGTDLWSFIMHSATVSRPYLSEWAHFNPVAHFWDHIDFMALVLLTVIGLAFSKKPRDPLWMALLLLSFAAALVMRRIIPIFAITALLIVPGHMESAAGQTLDSIARRIKPVLAGFILTCMIAACVFGILRLNKADPMQIEIPQKQFPAQIIRFLENSKVEGNILCFFDWAEYCIWRLYPNCRVFLDGRFTDAYDVSTINAYLAFIYLGPDWDKVLDKYKADIVMIHRQNPVYPAMLTVQGWQLTMETESAALFMRTAVHQKTLDDLKSGRLSIPARVETEFFP